MNGATPALYTNPRPYDPHLDATHWSLQRVVAYLAQFLFRRKAEKSGQITLFANTDSVGRAFARHPVDVAPDALTLHWIICDEYGHEIKRHPSQALAYDLISQRRLAKRRKSD